MKKVSSENYYDLHCDRSNGSFTGGGWESGKRAAGRRSRDSPPNYDARPLFRPRTLPFVTEIVFLPGLIVGGLANISDTETSIRTEKRDRSNNVILESRALQALLRGCIRYIRSSYFYFSGSWKRKIINSTVYAREMLMDIRAGFGSLKSQSFWKTPQKSCISSSNHPCSYFKTFCSKKDSQQQPQQNGDNNEAIIPVVVDTFFLVETERNFLLRKEQYLWGRWILKEDSTIDIMFMSCVCKVMLKFYLLF
ncbi:hypothetical protein V6N13_081160 [Hibiscus sabdariffa]